MIPIALKELAMACGGRLVCTPEEENITVTSVSTDSRQVKKGTLFGAIKGERSDGHDYIKACAESGAAAALCEKEPEGTDIPYILVPSTLKALQDMAAHVLKKAGIPVVAVTGSAGKTSTKEMIASVLSRKYNVLKTSGNHNNALGLPLTVFELEKEHEVAVLEHGISRFGEMSVLAAITRPDVVVFTNIGDCHLEDLGDHEGVFKAKGEIFSYMSEDAKIILNGDDAILGAQTEIKGIRPLFYGMGENCDVTARDIHSFGFEGSEFTVVTRESSFKAELTAPGRHMICNALAAVSAGRVFGLSDEEIRLGIGDYRPVKGRFNICDTGKLILVDDCYNANPVSMKASLENLSYAKGRKVAVLGDMGELGKDSDELHRGVGAYFGKVRIDVLCCAGSSSRFIFEAAKEADPHLEAYWFGTAGELTGMLPAILQDKDTVLVKASRFCKFETIVKAIKEIS